jgi:ribosome recycling factor
MMRAADDFAAIRARMEELARERRRQHGARGEEVIGEADRQSVEVIRAELKARIIAQNRRFRLG